MSEDRSPVEKALTDDAAPADRLIERYLGGVAILREAVSGMTREQLAARPIAGKLSSQEVACHVVDSDQFMIDRMKRTIATDRPLIVGVESIDYPGPLHYVKRDLELDLRLLEVQREQFAADLRRVAPDVWERTAVHSEHGLLTLRRLMLHAIRHLEQHATTIDEKRTALGL